MQTKIIPTTATFDEKAMKKLFADVEKIESEVKSANYNAESHRIQLENILKNISKTFNVQKDELYALTQSSELEIFVSQDFASDAKPQIRVRL